MANTAYYTLLTGTNAIDSLLGSRSWVATPKSHVTLTYSFMDSTPTAIGSVSDVIGFAPMTSIEQNGVTAALAAWASVANVTFVPVASGGTLQFGTNLQSAASAAYTWAPNNYGYGGHVFLNNLYYNDQGGIQNFAVGSYGYEALVHEIGHALGLKHPGNYNAGGGTVLPPFLPSSTDNVGYTIMSYNQPGGIKDNPTGPMMYDISAIQYLYGANTSSTGNHVYSFGNSIAGLQCIWDPGPNNTIDASATTQATVINLNPGTFSTIGAGPTDSSYPSNGVSLAYGTVVTKVLAGSGGATIIGNNLGDTLVGGAGNDIFYVDGGVYAKPTGANTTIIGNGGTDTVVYHHAKAGYRITTDTSGHVFVSESGFLGDGTTTMTGIARLQFADTVVTAPVAPGGTLQAGTGQGVTVLSAEGTRVTGGTDTGVVARLYQAALARQPDAAGLKAWVEGYEAAVPAADRAQAAGSDWTAYVQALASDPINGQSMAYAFTHSPEFLGTFGTLANNTIFVTQLYRNVLHRNPDAAGLAGWVNAANAGMSHETILVGFAVSQENVIRTADWITCA